jgi:GAF domain-containing protein
MLRSLGYRDNDDYRSVRALMDHCNPVTDTGDVSNVEREILVTGARALAHVEGLEPRLEALIETIASASEVQSAAIVVRGADGLEIVATFGIDAAATAGLAEAIARPVHPIARTFEDATPTFDVRPTAPGGPALRSHLPLIVIRGGTDSVLGVLTLAHDRPTDPEMRQVLEAAADLAAVAIELGRG